MIISHPHYHIIITTIVIGGNIVAIYVVVNVVNFVIIVLNIFTFLIIIFISIISIITIIIILFTFLIFLFSSLSIFSSQWSPLICFSSSVFVIINIIIINAIIHTVIIIINIFIEQNILTVALLLPLLNNIDWHFLHHPSYFGYVITTIN